MSVLDKVRPENKAENLRDESDCFTLLQIDASRCSSLIYDLSVLPSAVFLDGASFHANFSPTIFKEERKNMCWTAAYILDQVRRGSTVGPRWRATAPPVK